MNSITPYFATLDKLNAVDPVEGLGTQFTLEFRAKSGGFIDRVYGTRDTCCDEAIRRGVPLSALRITGRAAL